MRPNCAGRRPQVVRITSWQEPITNIHFEAGDGKGTHFLSGGSLNRARELDPDPAQPFRVSPSTAAFASIKHIQATAKQIGAT
eukprot:3488564-Rhodomonas_salina.1